MEKAKKAPNKMAAAAMNRVIMGTLVRRGRQAMRTLDTNSRDAVNISQKLLLRLLDENKNTEYGKKYGFAGIHTIAEY